MMPVMSAVFKRGCWTEVGAYSVRTNGESAEAPSPSHSFKNRASDRGSGPARRALDLAGVQTAGADLDLDDLVEDISVLDDDTIFNFIKNLDLTVADYSFTKRLRDHFVKEIKDEDHAGFEYAHLLQESELQYPALPLRL